MQLVWLIAASWSGPALAATPRTPLVAEPLQVGEETVALVVKWHDDLRARATDDGQVEFAEPVDRRALDATLSAFGARLEPWIDLPGWRLRALEGQAEARSGRQQPDLAGIHRVVIANATPEQLADLGARLLALPHVEFVDTESAPVPPPVDIAPTTPDLTANQGYRGPDPGIDADYALTTWGLTGAGVRISDCEYGWDIEHEDLVDGSLTVEKGQTWPDWVVENGWHHHGTAVAGELVGQANAYGVTGIAPSADFGMYPEWTNEDGGRRATAIASAIADSAPGDVVLLEMQTGGPNGAYVPAEYNQAVWTVVRAGVDADVVVVAAAGNGAEDLDAPEFQAYRDRGDSGSIIVGAGTANTTHDRMSFSTYGTRVDVQGWGTQVFTTGYGTFAMYGDDPHQAYTAGFNGTSSASPIVTGAAALLVEASLRYRLEPIQPEDLRDLLVATGTPAAKGSGIGPLPDLEAALTQLDADLDILPAVESITANEGVEGVLQELTAEVTVLPTLTPTVTWRLPDGTEVGTGEALLYTPPDDGTIELDVTVEDDWGRTATERVAFTAQNADPVIRSVEATGTLEEGALLDLTAAATDVAADPLTYAWTVDGTALAGAGATVQHTFADDGAFLVEVTVDDGDGGVVSDSVTLTIVDVPAAIDLQVPTEAPRRTETALAITIVDPGDDSYEVSWDLGDGSTASGTELTHAWEERGPHTVTATVRDEDGAEQVFTAAVDVVARPLCGCSSSSGSGLGWLALLGLVGLRRRRA